MAFHPQMRFSKLRKILVGKKFAGEPKQFRR